MLSSLTKIADIVLLTETRGETAQVARRWQEEVEQSGEWIAQFSPSGSPHTGGTAVLVRRCVSEKMGALQWDGGGLPQGRMTRLTCMWERRRTAFIALYVPAKPHERTAFLQQLEEVQADSSAVTVVGGDYNCTLCAEESQTTLPHLLPGRQQLARWVANWALADSWTGAARKRGDDPGWTKFTHGGAGSRIDRIYISAEARDRCTAARTVGLGDSDHRAVVITLGQRRKRTRWRLNTELLQRPELRRQVSAVWYRQLDRLHRTDASLQEMWAAFKSEAAAVCAAFGKQEARKRRAARDVAQRQLRTATTIEERAAAKATLRQLEEYEEQGRRVRAGVEATVSDHPSAAFFQRLTAPATKLDVRALTLPSGQTTSDPAVIAAAVNELWQDVYGAGHPAEEQTQEVTAARAASLGRLHRRLDPAAALSLAEPYSAKEVKAALRSLPQRASPGNDGLPPAFYLTFWKMLRYPFTQLLNEAAAGGALPSESLQARIILLAKTTAAAPSAADFRPISLLGTDYKIWAKALSRRIAGVIEKVCSPRQTGFIPRRSIQQNIAFTRDLLEYMREDSSGAIIAFLDFEKAFDRVSWTYRDEVLRKLGFPEETLRTIAALYRGAESQLELNGEAGPWFTPTRGVRQGCPLSPLIYALFAEPLGALLDDLGNGRDGGEPTGIALPPVRRGAEPERIGGSQYADDTVVYCRSAAALSTVLEGVEGEFCVATGARLHRGKTRVLPVGRHASLPETIAGARVIAEGDVVKSLGALYSVSANAPGRLPQVLEVMQQRLERLLYVAPSLLGRALAANALLSSCLWYFCMFEVLTLEQSNAASRIVRKCIWDSLETQERRAQLGYNQVRGAVSMARLYAPRKLGGLAIIEPATMAKALHARAVNAVLAARGEWWSSWSVAIIERAAGTGPHTGVDGLAVVEARGAIARKCPSYWRAALSAWSELQLQHPAQRPHWIPAAWTGSTLVTWRVRRRSNSARHHKALDLLAAHGTQYLSDIWDWRLHQPLQTMPVVQRVPAAARARVGVSEQALIEAFMLVRNSVTVAEISAMREATPRGWHRRRDGSSGAFVVRCDGDNSSECNECYGRRRVAVVLFGPADGRGALPRLTADSPAEQLLCACQLSPVLTDEHSSRGWGDARSTTLMPPLLKGEGELDINSKVAALRATFRARTFPEAAQRPECEAAWTPLLTQPAPSKEQWEELWLQLHRAQGGGEASSRLWLVMHRRMVLRSLTWVQQAQGSSAACLMCSSGEAETLEHLLHSCPSAAATWQRVEGWMAEVGMAAAATSAEGRLLGRVRPEWGRLHSLLPEEAGAADEDMLARWCGIAWTEVRGVVIAAIWAARCKVLYGGARREMAVAQARALMRHRLVHLMYRHAPEICCWELPVCGFRPGPARAAFFAFFWKALQRHLW